MIGFPTQSDSNFTSPKRTVASAIFGQSPNKYSLPQPSASQTEYLFSPPSKAQQTSLRQKREKESAEFERKYQIKSPIPSQKTAVKFSGESSNRLPAATSTHVTPQKTSPAVVAPMASPPVFPSQPSRMRDATSIGVDDLDDKTLAHIKLPHFLVSPNGRTEKMNKLTKIQKMKQEWAAIENSRLQRQEEEANRRKKFDTEKVKIQMKRDLEEQIAEREKRKEQERAEKQRELQRVRALVEEAKMEQERSYAKSKEKADQFRHEVEAYEKLRQRVQNYHDNLEKEFDHEFLNAQKMREQELEKKAREDRAEQMQMWQEIKEENERNKEMQRKREKMNREMDKQLMVEYDAVMQREEQERQQLLSSIQNRVEATADVGRDTLLAQQQRQKEEEQRYQAWIAEEERIAAEKDRAQAEKKKAEQREYQEYLMQQQRMKQEQQYAEFIKVEQERVDLENELKRLEQLEQQEKMAKKMGANDYLNQLRQQARETEERRIMEDYALTDQERLLNKQFLPQ